MLNKNNFHIQNEKVKCLKRIKTKISEWITI